MKIFPTEGQKDLLVENRLYDSFFATWVSIEGINAVAMRLEVAPEAKTICDLQTAVRLCDPSPGTQWFWIAQHAPGWSHILTLSGAGPCPDTLSLNRQRVFELAYIGGIEEIYPLAYTYDGKSDADFFDVLEYAPYWEDFDSSHHIPVEEELEQQLIIMGRITGRFYDREFFSSQGLLCKMP
ncbi:hypothetical protein [Streptosporangium sp. 'caverna']|uniref:hypothetical protein n=1 Tax=Streptosporangium sp. 'caverna' TaxID=2202249 RepID=UPI0013A696F7|nr:hypothetical protein [Streptosporangium sp. 'caverna']